MIFRTRFAPSPTGPLHLGHAYSAILAFEMARAKDGDFLLRIEDIDRSRSKPEWETQIFDDLAWLGLEWPQPVMRQSDQSNRYRSALQALWDKGLAYPCTCNRRDIAAAANAPQEGAGPLIGPDGIVYPGTCRGNQTTIMPTDTALRLRMDSVIAPDQKLRFLETGSGPNGETGEIVFTLQDLTTEIGDIVLARKDMGTSYHLSVVLDDAAQGISHVVRGQDLFEATKIHVALQTALGLPTPVYHHHALIRDENGKRLAKRDDARSIATYRADGVSPADIRRMVGLTAVQTATVLE